MLMSTIKLISYFENQASLVTNEIYAYLKKDTA